MRNYSAIIMLSALLVGCGAATPKVDDSAVNNPIVTALDLTKVDNDRVPVVINPGRFKTDKVTYRLPKVVQGTYSVSDFGKYVDDFKALDYNQFKSLMGIASDSLDAITSGIKSM